MKDAFPQEAGLLRQSNKTRTYTRNTLETQTDDKACIFKCMHMQITIVYDTEIDEKHVRKYGLCN